MDWLYDFLVECHSEPDFLLIHFISTCALTLPVSYGLFCCLLKSLIPLFEDLASLSVVNLVLQINT